MLVAVDELDACDVDVAPEDELVEDVCAVVVVCGLTLVVPELVLVSVSTGARLSFSPHEVRPPAIPIASQPKVRSRTLPKRRIRAS